MAAKDLIAFSCLLESNAVHRVLLAVKGVSYNVSVAAVEGPNHLGGIGKSGRTTKESARQLLLPWIAKRDKFSVGDLQGFAEENSVSKGAAYAFTYLAVKEKLITRTKPGEFKVNAVAKKLNGEQGKRNGSA